ncbi:MAG: efflux RND transporter periplasmic adaptor subunit, partial [Clostridia bacterium]
GYEGLLGNYINEVPRSEEIAMEPQIISPISGVITDVKVKESDITAKSASIATISDFNTLLVRVSIPEMYIERIKVGQKAEITGQAFKGEKISGTVKEIHPTAKQKSGITGGGETVVDAVIKIDSPNPKLRPGYSVSARICTDMHKDAAVLPYECINEDEKGANSVFIIKDGIAIERPVVTGFELDHELEIKLGLAGKERVIINPPQSLKSGNEVKVRGAG